MKIAMLIPDNRDEIRDYSDSIPRFGQAPTALLEGLTEIGNCEIHVICCTHTRLVSPQKLSANVWYHSSLVPRIGWRPAMYAGCVIAIRHRLRSVQPDIVHGQGTERYCALAAASSGFPNVITIHGNMSAVARSMKARIGTFYWNAARLESFALGRTNGVFCNSAYTEHQVRHRTPQTWRVPNALRSEFFTTPLPPHRRQEQPNILVVGEIAPHKRQIQILDIGSQLFEAGYRFQLKFIGGLRPGTYGREFSERVANNARFAEYVGPRTANDMVRIFDAGDALIHFPTEESFGLVVAEALSRNLKFFGCRTGGVPDIGDKVEFAELYDANDWSGLYRALATWLDAGTPRPTAAARQMRERYRPSAVASEHLKIYREVLARNGKEN